jgi:hypothetical protein
MAELVTGLLLFLVVLSSKIDSEIIYSVFPWTLGCGLTVLLISLGTDQHWVHGFLIIIIYAIFPMIGSIAPFGGRLRSCGLLTCYCNPVIGGRNMSQTVTMGCC